MLKLPGGNLIELPGKFPHSIEMEARRLHFRDELYRDREEVRGFTLDAIDSPDLDDAIWLEEKEDGWMIQVTISDVDSLVRKDSYTDIEALSRVISHYFPDKRLESGRVLPKRTVPMLPKILSENRLSLLEGKTRPTLTVEMHLGRELNLDDVNLKMTFLTSARRLGLREYGDQLIVSDPGLPLRDYWQMAQNLNAKRRSEQSFALQELRPGVSTDEDGMIREGSISSASLIVQEFMVLANHAVGRFLQEQKQPSPFRNHLPARHNPPTREQIIHEVEQHGNYWELVDNIRDIYGKMLSSATYEPDPRGHYGLGLPVYLHFTSPIRRYADLVVHRIVKALISEQSQPYTPEEISNLCQHINKRQRRLATLRANLEGTNSFQNYQRSVHLLSREKNREPDYLKRLLEYLRDQRIGNAYFEFTASAGVNLELTCTASVRFQRVLHKVSLSARADKGTVKNQTARLLLKKIRELVMAHSASEQRGGNGQKGSRVTSDSAGGGNESHKPSIEIDQVRSQVQLLYEYCENNRYSRPIYHYESWNGGVWPISCHCQIDDELAVTGHGDSRLAAKNAAAQKLLDYLQSGQPVRRSVPPV